MLPLKKCEVPHIAYIYFNWIVLTERYLRGSVRT